MPKKSELKKADRQYTNDKLKVEELKQKKKELDAMLQKAESDLRNSENTYKRIALEKYDYPTVQDILDQAEKKHYSKQNINSIKLISKTEWENSLTPEIIRDLYSIEKYNKKNTPLWERSPFMHLGELFVNCNDEDEQL